MRGETTANEIVLCAGAAQALSRPRTRAPPRTERRETHENELNGRTMLPRSIPSRLLRCSALPERDVHVPWGYEDGRAYRIGFSPLDIGAWRQMIESNPPALRANGQSEAVARTVGSHGPVRPITGGYRLKFANDMPFRLVGTTSSSWGAATRRNICAEVRDGEGVALQQKSHALFPGPRIGCYQPLRADLQRASPSQPGAVRRHLFFVIVGSASPSSVQRGARSPPQCWLCDRRSGGRTALHLSWQRPTARSATILSP